MRVVIAPDSFGSTLGAADAATAMAEGWTRQAPADRLVRRPMSDGGPGFLDALEAAGHGTRHAVRVTDPLGRPVEAAVLLDGPVGYVESALACGLHLLTEAERDPTAASSWGVGQLLRAAVEAGARHVVVGLGGSATNDGGAGLLAALGLELLDGAGAGLPPGAGPLHALDRITGAPALRGVGLEIAGDVDHGLTGTHGASATFGRQKLAPGADPAVLDGLDAALERLATVLERDLPGCPSGLASRPGGGAAGGLGAALLALGATRSSGFDLVAARVGLAAEIAAADLVLTGEGRFDAPSLRGKVPVGVAALAVGHGVPCLVLAGQVEVGRREQAAAGVEASYSVAEHAGSVAASLADPAGTLAALAGSVAGQWSR